MSKRLFKTMVAVLAIAAAAAGPVRGQNASPDVTLDFTSNTWGIPEGTEGKTAVENSYTSGGYTITLCGSSGNGYYFSLTDPYILLGKQGSYLQLPAFESAVDSIHVVGTSSASTAVEQNIYVGDVAVSTQTTGMKNVTQKYVIAENYRTAGTIYRIKVTSANNTQIKKVYVYFAQAPAVPHTVRFADGNDGWQVQDVTAGSAAVTAPAVLQNVMAGDNLVVTAPATLPGKVKSVKAVKYVAPAATVTTAPTATEATIAANSTAALVNAGAANGGTMMYAVTTTNVQPASTADFSASIPTAEGRSAGTYYVWYYVKADDSHTDSEISATAVAVTVNGIVWTSSDMTSNFYAQFDGWSYNNTHQGITVTASGDANGGWSQNNIDVNDGSGTITFTSSVGNIKSIVISAVNLNNMDMSVPTGWTANAMSNNPRTLSWSGTASATVNLPLSNMQNIGGISTIVFTLE